MRIGIDATSLPPAPAGAGRYIRGLISGLAALDTPHEYFVFIKKADRARFAAFERPNLSLATIPYARRPARLFWEMTRTSRVIDRFDLDVWHAPHYVVPLNPGRCKLVVTFHDMGFHLFPEWHSRAKRLVFRWMLPRAARAADRLIAVSRATGDEVSCILRIDADRITVVHHGIDPSFQPVEDARVLAGIRRRYRLDAPYILTVGTIDRRKNLPTLLRAYRALVERDRTGCLFVIAGHPDNAYRELARMIRSCGLNDRVRLPGYVDEADLPGLYTGARLFVSASLYEGFGFPALEAMACGAPVLTAPAPSVAETMDRNSVVADAANPEAWYERMSCLLTHPPDRPEAVETARRLIERHTWTTVARQTVRVYEEVMERIETPDAANGRTVVVSSRSSATNGVVAQAVLKTIVYADLFDFPLSAREVHEGLIGCSASPDQVSAALRALRLSGMIVEQNAWYMLKGREDLEQERSVRSRSAARLFEKHRRVLRWLCACPFVRMAALSGALAFENCREDSDIDLFLIVDKRRLWSVYAFLAGAAKVLRKRALLCMNYLIGRPDYRIEERDFFTAHQIAYLKPLFGWAQFRRFTAANAWVMDHIPHWNGHSNGKAGFAELTLSGRQRGVKRLLEWALCLPVFDPVEWLVYRAYARRILRKSAGKPHSDVRLSRERIKLHTNDHSRRIMDEFERRMAGVQPP